MLRRLAAKHTCGLLYQGKCSYSLSPTQLSFRDEASSPGSESLAPAPSKAVASCGDGVLSMLARRALSSQSSAGWFAMLTGPDPIFSGPGMLPAIGVARLVCTRGLDSSEEPRRSLMCRCLPWRNSFLMRSEHRGSAGWCTPTRPSTRPAYYSRLIIHIAPSISLKGVCIRYGAV